MLSLLWSINDTLEWEAERTSGLAALIVLFLFKMEEGVVGTE